MTSGILASVVPTMLLCLASTIVVEVSCAKLIFGIDGKEDLAIVLAAQIMTNPFVVGMSSFVLPSLIDARYILPCLLVLEAAAFLAEGAVYRSSGFDRPFRLSLVLNLVSFSIGLAAGAVLQFLP